MIKLHIGCGNKKLHGFTNVDIREDVDPDVVCDIANLGDKFDGDSVDLIYACHVLEHFPSKELTHYPHTFWKVLSSWYKALKPGGILRLSVPDTEKYCKYYILHNNLSNMQSFFHGGQKYDHDVHLSSWDFKTMQEILHDMGFECHGLWDWRQTEHSHVDDYSQMYLPHMDKTNGILLSLNVEYKKRLDNPYE